MTYAKVRVRRDVLQAWVDARMGKGGSVVSTTAELEAEAARVLTGERSYEHRRVPLEPLLAFTHLRSMPVLAERCSVSVRTLQRARVTGSLTLRAADMVATGLGVHPCSIWTDWFDHAS